MTSRFAFAPVVALAASVSFAAAPQEPPALALPDLAGRTVTLAEYRDRSPVLLFNYRGNWCVSCVDQLLFLESMKKKELRDVTVLAVSTDPPAKTRDLLESVEASKGIRLTHRFLAAPPVATLHRPRRHDAPDRPTMPPSWILIDRRGREVWRFVESEHRMRPSRREVRSAVARLGLLHGPTE